MVGQGYITLPVDSELDLKQEYAEDFAPSVNVDRRKRRRRRIYAGLFIVLLGGIAFIPIASSSSSNSVPDAISNAWDYSQQRMSDFWNSLSSSEQDEVLDEDDDFDFEAIPSSFPSDLESPSRITEDISLDVSTVDNDIPTIENGADTLEEMKEEDELEVMLPASGLQMPILSADRPRTPAAEIDAQYCPDGNCKFLFPFRVFEQESKAQRHLYSAAIAAKALGRVLVLPHVKGSRMNACYGNAFDYYYQADALQRLGFKTIMQDGLSF